MNTFFHWNIFRKVMVIIVGLVLIGGLGWQWTPAQSAAGVAEIPKDLAARPASPEGWGDDGIYEVGVEWINDFPGTADDRSHWDESCDGLYYGLLDIGWTGRFHWTDWSAWETDFKRSGAGGYEDSYADNVDIAMACTHGAGTYDSFWDKNLSSVYFGSTHTDHHLSPGEAYMAYGDKDLEWLAFDSCSVLSDGGPAPYYNRGYWAATMNKLHLLLGFKNTMYVSAPGDGLLWGMYMKGFWFMPSYTVTQAWFKAVDYVQPTVTCARVLAQESAYFNDYLWGEGYVNSDPVEDGDYYYWDHCSTGAKLNTEGLRVPDQPVSVPALHVIQREVTEDYIWNRIASAFDMTGTLQADRQFFYLVDLSGGITRTLQVDRASGGFNFINQSELWAPPVITPTLPGGDLAFQLIETFFGSQGEGLPGVWYRSGMNYGVEEIVGVHLPVQGAENQPEQEISRMPVDGYALFGRTYSTQVPTLNGIQLADFPVVGPGSALRVYLGDGGEVIGVQGGARDIEETGDQIPIMEPYDAWDAFLKDPDIALPQVPWLADYITYTGAAVLGYYEMPTILPQDELIPVWIFSADFYTGGVLLESGVTVNIPAAIEAPVPVVTITAPADGSIFVPGDMIQFTGTASGGTPPYTFEWSSNHDGDLGTGPTVNAMLSTSSKGGELQSHTIVLKVTDANSMVGTATITVDVLAMLHLPLITR